MEDVGINQFQFNVGQQLLSLGIVIFEIPSNMILYKVPLYQIQSSKSCADCLQVGPGKWLTVQLFLFGLVSTFQAWQKDYSSYLATRFLLGVTESGYIPGGLWTLSTWYTRSETAKRTMIFFFGNQLGQASAKLIAYGAFCPKTRYRFHAAKYNRYSSHARRSWIPWLVLAVCSHGRLHCRKRRSSRILPP
jgi:MFS family permease